MTTRDPRSRDVPPLAAEDGVREPTQSLRLDADEAADLARGTHDLPGARPVTQIESPLGRARTAPPPRDDDADAYRGVVLGSYRVLELLGKGGMGFVYRAEHVKLGREVALKLLRRDYASRREAVARFFQEARTVNRVRHRNIVDVTDFVELDDGTTYIIMELLAGTSLGAWARGGVELPRALGVLVQICDGLGAAHQVGVIHRDLKPDNIIVAPFGEGELVKLLDFGVAKLINRDDIDVGFETAAGSVIGTPAYMSPEQAGGMLVDARSDIYSLGAIMYELFCGEPMFRGRSFGEYVRKHLTEMPVAPRQTAGGAGLDPALESVILRCLDKDPDQRFASIFALREVLVGLLGNSAPYHALAAIGAHPSGPLYPQPPLASGAHGRAVTQPASQTSGVAAFSGQHAALQPVGAAASYPAGPTGIAPPSTSWWIWLGGAAAAAALGVGAAVWYGRSGDHARHPAAASAPANVAMTAVNDAVAPGAATPGSAAAAPSATAPEPVAPSPAAPAVRVVEVRFDAEPAGGVFAEGKPTELCRTPCAFNIDLNDGGRSDVRHFVVKHPGYRDGSITVDLNAATRTFHTILAPIATRPARPLATKPDRRPPPRPAKPASVAKPAPRDRLIEPSPAAPPPPPPPKKPAPIDPADTLDPFRKK